MCQIVKLTHSLNLFVNKHTQKNNFFLENHLCMQSHEPIVVVLIILAMYVQGVQPAQTPLMFAFMHT